MGEDCGVRLKPSKEAYAYHRKETIQRDYQ